MTQLLDFPISAYRYRPLKQGMRGQDVAALQLNLGLEPSGAFGPKTKQVVEEFQRHHKLVVDGIAGVHTQEAMSRAAASGPEAAQKTPPGLLEAMVRGESGSYVGAVSEQHSDGSRDAGWVQRNLSPAKQKDERTVQDAFSGTIAIGQLAKELRQRKDANMGRPGVKSNEDAWRYAILAHNWPAAAEQFVNGTIADWEYTAKDRQGASRKYHMNEEADWIKDIGVPGVETGYQWARFYVNSKLPLGITWPD